MTANAPRTSTQVHEVMATPLESIGVDDTLELAATKMHESNVGSLAVLEGEWPVGIITDRDIVVRATAKGLDPKVARVRGAMTPQVVYCFRDQRISEAARLMRDYAVRRLLVVDGDKRPVGMISVDDLAALPGGAELAGAVLEQVSPVSTGLNLPPS